MNYIDPSGHNLSNPVPGCTLYDDDYNCVDGVHHGNGNQMHHPDPVDTDALSPAGKKAYQVYKDLWNDKTGWWWFDPDLGGDGQFTIYDFMVLVLAFELQGASANKDFTNAWTEALARSSRTWGTAMHDPKNPKAVLGVNTDLETNTGKINWIFAQTGTFRTYSSFLNPTAKVLNAISAARKALDEIINPSVADWKNGCVGDRPCQVGSNSADAPNLRLWYINDYVAAGCPHYGGSAGFIGSCGKPDKNDFSFVLTLDQLNACGAGNCSKAP